MSGPRVTSGAESKQDYKTPLDFMGAVEGRFGPVRFDLAAHRMNAQHRRYFAPEWFEETVRPGKTDTEELLRSLGERGARYAEAAPMVEGAFASTHLEAVKIRVRNYDPDAHGFNAFAHAWCQVSATFRAPDGGPGLLYLNCEFSDCEAWASRCGLEAERGANIALLTPAAVGSNWWRDTAAGRADTYLLNGRLSFDGKNSFPKDCMLSHFHPGATGRMAVWDWRHDRIAVEWKHAA